eukprot:m.477884 g.477884  ORF g.477884 m.477884 type:complete len:102 (-) comp45162_c0_seq1:238-543(-)
MSILWSFLRFQMTDFALQYEPQSAWLLLQRRPGSERSVFSRFNAWSRFSLLKCSSCTAVDCRTSSYYEQQRTMAAWPILDAQVELHFQGELLNPRDKSGTK